MNHPTVPFAQFLAKFPEIELPVILHEEIHHAFSAENDPLTNAMIRQYLLPIEEMDELDDLTEFVPCFQLPNTEGFHALVYWKAGLMNYQYTLVTFTQKGEFIDRSVIGGTYLQEEILTLSVATINEENEIYIASGQSKAADGNYDPTTSTAIEMELLPDGQITVN
jgi:hypothetical protein